MSADNAHVRLYIGRWQMNHDGWPGTLDIDRLRQAGDRIGTYLASWNGQAYPVYGYLYGRQLVFFISANSHNPPDGALARAHFTADLFSWDDQNMAGLEVQDGQTYSFMATKASFPSHTAASSHATRRDAYLGHWKMNHDGWRGDLYLNAGDGPNAIAGRYQAQGGTWHAVQGTIDERHFQFQIWLDDWQSFSGYLFSWNKGLMAGVTWWKGQEFGFQAFRQADSAAEAGPSPSVAGEGSMKGELTREVTYPYQEGFVWQALTDPWRLACWLLPNTFEPRLGHRFHFTRQVAGGADEVIECEVIGLQPRSRIAFTWRDPADPVPAVVTWALQERGPGRTQVRLAFAREDKAATGPDADAAARFWDGCLARLLQCLHDEPWR